MRGEDIQQHDLFSYGSLEEPVLADHLLRPIRTMVDEALQALDSSQTSKTPHRADAHALRGSPSTYTTPLFSSLLGLRWLPVHDY